MKYCTVLLLSSVILMAGCGQSVEKSKPAEKDTGAPVLTEITPVGTNTDDPNPHYTFKSTENGTINFSGDCTSTLTRATAGTNTIRLMSSTTPAPSNFVVGTTYSNCEVTVTDESGNVSDALTITSFTVREYDKRAPILTEVTPVPVLTNNTTPDYTFHTDEEGDIIYGGACASATTTATVTLMNSGVNTIPLNSLKQGTYSNCTIQVKDLAGNVSIALPITAFTIDLTPPRLGALTSIVQFTNNSSPSFILTSNEAGLVTYAGDCSDPSYSIGAPAPATVVQGPNTIVYSNLSDHAFNNCTIRVTDQAGNISAALLVKRFTVDTIPPVVSVVTPVPALDNEPRPRFTFATSEISTISYPTVCKSTKVSARIGNNTLVFMPLGDTTQDVVYNCSIDVTDRAGNTANLLIPQFTVDLKLPVLTVIQAVTPNPASATPPYQPAFAFASDELGSIVYAGGCSSPLMTANNGVNNLTFNTIKTANYPNCTLSVIDAAGNKSLALASPFVVDMTPPTLKQIVAVPTYVNTVTPSVTFSSSEPGVVTAVGGKCSVGFQTTTVTTGTNTATFNALTEGVYDDCTVTVTDSLGNISRPLKLSTFTVDTTPPVVAEVIPVPTPDNNATPSYTFSTNEIGTMTYAGGCSSLDTTANIGNNRIKFQSLADGTYSACTITVYDRAGNFNALPLPVTSFTVDTVAPILSTAVTVTPNPASATAPNQPAFSFDSTEVGTVIYAGGCSSPLPSAVIGTNNLTFNAIKTASYPNCTISVLDAAGNKSLPLAAPFAVDMTPPTLKQVIAVPTYTNATTPSFTLASTEVATVTAVGGSCGAVGLQSVAINAGNTLLTFNTMAEGLYDNCTVVVTDALGNVSAPLNLSAFMIDTTPPVVAEVTPVPTPDNNATPSYTFSTNEIGTMAYAGGCSSLDTTANIGNNRIKFQSLVDGTYSACTIIVYDRAGNTNALPLPVTAFMVDTVAPVLSTAVTVTPNPASATAPNQPTFNFDSTEDGTVVYGGGCSASLPAAVNGNNGLTFNTIKTASYSNCTISVLDAAGNKSLPLAASFVVDMTPPKISQAVAVPTYTNSTTPSFTLASTEVATVTAVGGSCGAVGLQSTAINAGNTVLTFNVMVEGLYDNCTVVVTDTLGNVSAPLRLSVFTVDTTPPVVSSVTPVPAFTNNATPKFTFATNEAGSMVYNSACISADATANTGDNRITFQTLADGVYNCAIDVYDRAGNMNTVTVPQFEVDTVAPVLSEIIGVTPNPTNDNTPDYTLRASKDGSLLYSGGCSSVTTSIFANTDTAITFNPLKSATYSRCAVRLQDKFGNMSVPLMVSNFTIDTIPPALRLITPVPTYTNNQTPSATFTSSESGHVSAVGGSCSLAAVAVVAGSNTVTFDALAEGLYNDCTITVTDDFGNVSLPLVVKPFTVDIQQPLLVMTKSVASLDNDSTPRFTLNSNEIGVISYLGSCTSVKFAAKAGDNVVDLSYLNDATYSDCEVTITDRAGNTSAPINVGTFTIDTVAPTVTELTAVTPSTTADETPDYTFTTDEAGALKFTGGCVSATNSAMLGSNTVTFSALRSKLYACNLTVTDGAGNISAVLDMTDFTVDTVAPILKARVYVPTPANNVSPLYTFYSSEPGDIVYAGTCGNASSATAVKGDNTISYVALTDGTYNDCSIQVKDSVNNISTPLAVRTFVVDTVAPTLTVVTPVPTSTTDTTPNFTFSSDENGRITYSGDCSSNAKAAYVANNLITFKTFSPQLYGDHVNCVVTVTDLAANTTNLNVPAFTIVKSVGLNDTGITLCGDDSLATNNNDINCALTGVSKSVDGADTDGDLVFAGQDALYGRDSGGSRSTPADGYKGFAFVKLDTAGTALASSAVSWACIQDKVTGLVWEVKTDDSGTQDKDNIYDMAQALTYVSDTNAANLCGANDWRLPTAEELYSIVNLGVAAPTIDSGFISNTVAAPYWSSQDVNANASQTWAVDFALGVQVQNNKTNALAVRLVRKP